MTNYNTEAERIGKDEMRFTERLAAGVGTLLLAAYCLMMDFGIDKRLRALEDAPPCGHAIATPADEIETGSLVPIFEGSDARWLVK